MAFGRCRFCGAYFEQTEAVCPVCAAAASGAPRLAPPAAPTESGSYDRLADKTRLVPSPRANDNVFQSVFVAGTVFGAAVLGAIGGWPMGVLAGGVLALLLAGLVSGGVLTMRGLRRR